MLPFRTCSLTLYNVLQKNNKLSYKNNSDNRPRTTNAAAFLAELDDSKQT